MMHPPFFGVCVTTRDRRDHGSCFDSDAGVASADEFYSKLNHMFRKSVVIPRYHVRRLQPDQFSVMMTMILLNVFLTHGPQFL